MAESGCLKDIAVQNLTVIGGGLSTKKNVNAAVLAPNVGDSGKIFLCDNTARAIVLPLCSVNDVGTNFKFIFTANVDNEHTITTGDTTNTTGDVFIGGLLVSSAAAVNTYIECGTDISRITLDDNVNDRACGVGSYVQCTMISATQWFLEGIINGGTDPDGTGSAVLSNVN